MYYYPDWDLGTTPHLQTKIISHLKHLNTLKTYHWFTNSKFMNCRNVLIYGIASGRK